VRGGPGPAPGAAPAADHRGATEVRTDAGAAAAPVARARPDAAPATPSAAAPASTARAPAVPAAAAADNPFDLEAAGLAALRALLDVPAAPRAASPAAKGPPAVPVALDLPGVRAWFAPLVSGGGLEVAERGRAPTLRLPAKAMFSSDGGTQVRTQGRELLRRVAGLLERWPESRLEIVGPMEPAAGAAAWSRSASRAVDVARVLSANGVAPARVTAVGVGASPAGEPAVEIVLLPPVAPAPGAR
jgi:outer membrane protein OmpA-like peptidoglycan-associated protein